MSCDLIMSSNSSLEDLAIADMMSVPLLPDQEDSFPSSGNHSSAEEGDSSSPSDSTLNILGMDCDQDKDSGIEFCGEDGSQPLEGLALPDKELVQSIIDMVEYYFSDANLLKDTFLLKHVRRNKEGYVSLKLITNFRKVKTFTRDWRVVAYSLKHSKLMQVNDQCTKVRRTLPLPSHDETQPSRTVLITGLSPSASLDTGALELFSRFGELVSFRMIKSADAVSSSEQHKDLKKFFARRPDLEGSSCVLVEFARQESAARAVKDINAESSVYSAYSLSDKTAAPAKKKPQPTVSNNNNSSNANNTNNKQQSTKKVKKGSKKQHVKAPESSDSEHQYSPEMRRRSSGSISSGYFSSSPRYTDFFERRNHGRTVSFSTSSGQATPIVRPRTRLDTAPCSAPTESSPWVQRRIAARAQTQPCVIVLREPRGPDGSNGFQQRRLVSCS